MASVDNDGKLPTDDDNITMDTSECDEENSAVKTVSTRENTIVKSTNSEEEESNAMETMSSDQSSSAIDISEEKIGSEKTLDSGNEKMAPKEGIGKDGIKETLDSDDSDTEKDTITSDKNETESKYVSSSTPDVIPSVDEDDETKDASDDETKDASDDGTKDASDDNMFDTAVATDSSSNHESTVSNSQNDTKGEAVLPFQSLAMEIEENDTEQSSNDVIVSASFDEDSSCQNTDLSQKCFKDTEGKISDSSEKIVTDDSADTHSEIFEKTNEAGTPPELIPIANIKEEPTTNIEDFLYSDASNFPQSSGISGSEEKGIPLRKFPAIVRAVETADYGVLQDLYLLLYLRNAWDTEKVLIQGILDFSGFNCSPESEDFDTRKLTLCTFSNDVLYKIKNLLGVQTSWTYHPNSTASAHGSGSEKAKLDAVEKILNFLRRPVKKSRQRRTRIGDSKSPRQKSRARRQAKAKPPPKASTSYDTSSSAVIDQSDDSVIDDLSHKVGLTNFKPGPLSFKLKASGLSDSEILKIEKELKEQISKGNAAQVKIILEKVDKDTIARKLKTSADKASTSKSSPVHLPVPGPSPLAAQTPPQTPPTAPSTPPPPAQSPPVVRELSPAQASPPTKPLPVSKETVGPRLTEKDKTVDSGTKEKVVNVANENEKDEVSGKDDTAASKDSSVEPKKKLKDFPLVFSCIEGTPEKLLIELYFVIFMQKADQEIDEIKEKILEFDGFPFSEDSREFQNRKSILNVMSENMVKDITRALYLDPKSDKTATEVLLLNFLKQPSEKLLRPTVIAPGMLEDIDVDLDDLSDSDDSISYEVVEKKVECVDLLSSDEEDKVESPKKKVEPVVPKPKPVASTPAIPPPPSKSSVVAAQPAPPPVTQPSQAQGSTVRSLRDFVTIKKIVETHPNEYLVDIYNLLYMKNCQPEDLRNDILDFEGFDFDKTSPDYTKRKLFLDRMLYNSVRRIYNTLIHNTREVKVFSKPTMIGEIFQFLLKLPDHDTSVPPPRPQPVTKTYSSFATVTNIVTSENLQTKEQQSTKLSDLKRVFQRVACFPCEYLVDVHKLLFMTDCDMKEIRTNIFNFKGFNFSVGSQEFNQRKMFLEYLTFHSLRKISSVLTTKTVDMRNSTKHELASHLTEVLKEYTTMTYEPEPEKPEVDVSVTPNIETNSNMSSISSNSAVEEIVVTPIILPLQSSPLHDQSEDMDITVSSSTSGENSKQQSGAALTLFRTNHPVKVKSQPPAPAVKNKASSTSVSSTKDSVCTSSTNKTSTKVVSSGSSRKGVSSPQIRTDSPSSSTPTVKPPKSLLKAKESNDKKRKASESPAQASQNMQFADINLPDIEKYRQIYRSNLNMLSKPSTPPSVNVSSSTTLTFQPDFIFQQAPQPLIPASASQRLKTLIPRGIGQPQLAPLLAPNTQLPIMHSFPPQPLPLQNSTFFVQQPPQYSSNTDSVSIPVECILQEGSAMGLPGPKRFKQMVPKFPDDQLPNRLHLEMSEIENPSSSLQLKIRDAMTKTLEDEEDCDKPLATLVGHPNDRMLKQQICEIVENTDLQDISMNGVIQKIFNMYPKFDLKYRKEFIKSTLRSLLYRLGDTQDSKKDLLNDSKFTSSNADSSVTTTNKRKSTTPCQKSS